MQLYYLGPKGTFSYLACRQYFSENEATFQPKSNLFEVIKSVADDDTSIGVVPIENSIEGTINIVADALAQQDVFAHGEIRLDINFALYGNGSNTISDIKKVYSIAPAISQTTNYIHQHQFDYDYVDSTIQSLTKIENGVAAIAPLGSGEAYGFTPIDTLPVIKNQQQFDQNATSLMFLITPMHDKPGLLASVLNTFALFNINLSWIESRPLKTQLGMYRFFVQADSAITTDIKKVIAILETLDFKVEMIGAFN